MTPHYTHNDFGYGIELRSPRGETRFIQDEDAEQFLSQLQNIKRVWRRGNPNPEIFDNCLDHQDNLHRDYFV